MEEPYFVYDLEFLPTPSARRATAPLLVIPDAERISTHALREEGDSCLATGLKRVPNFYPRPPRGGRPSPSRPHLSEAPISTHALREEGDYFRKDRAALESYFYPRPPRGGRHCLDAAPFGLVVISTHALREEGDPQNFWLVLIRGRFLPTPSARRATCLQSWRRRRYNDFYPRPPRGGRRF